MKKLFILLLILSGYTVKAQKIDSIFFNLYTDSLKKGVYNYINVVGKLNDGSFYPLMADEVKFSSSAGTWKGNSLIIDSSYRLDSVVVYASLINGKNITRSTVVYMKKNLFEGPLKTEKELLEEWKKPRRRQLVSR